MQLFSVLMLALVLVLALTIVKGAQTNARDVTASDPNGFIDQARGTYLIAQLDPSQPNAGQFSFAVPGVGLFLGDTVASVDVQSDVAVVVRYNGAGTLDRAATLDPEFARWTEPSGQAAPVTFQLLAQLNPGQRTGTAELVYNGQAYLLASTPPPTNADTTLAAIADVTARQDWTALYQYADRDFRATMGETEFAAWVSEGLQPLGTVVGAQVTSAPVYTVHKGGYATAVGTITLTLAKDGGQTTLPSQVALIFDGSAWKFMTLDASP